LDTNEYTIVINLSKIQSLDLVLPQAYVCSVDKDHKPAYIQALAMKSNVETYISTYRGSTFESIIDICEDLRIENIESIYNRNKKKPESLNTLFANPKVKQHIEAQINKKLIRVLDIICKENMYLCWDLKRKEKACDNLLHCSAEDAIPQLSFSKTQTGIKYIMKLNVGETVLSPYQHSVEIVSEMPAVILVDRQIIKVQHLNASKVKPFVQKESVFIPEKLTKDYFSKFVLDVMGLVDVEVDGFEISKVTQPHQAALCWVYDLILHKWTIDIKYKYDGFEFFGSDVSKRKTKLLFDEDKHLKVIECIRHEEEESKFGQILTEYGFDKNYQRRYFYGDTPYATIELANEKADELAAIFEIDHLEIDNKILKISKLNIGVIYNLNIDWFDIKGVVTIGDVHFPIARLFQNIIKDDPFFKLGDGSFVLIPTEIMSKFSQLVRFATIKGDQFRIAKSHHTIIEQLEGKPMVLNHHVDENDFKFQPSQHLKATLRPYQLQGAEWLVQHRINGLGACLADDMGLGKTLQTIAALLHAKEALSLNTDQKQAIQLDLFGEVHTISRFALTSLIILPASLVFNWANELKKYAPSLQVLIFTGVNRRKAEKTLSSFDVILTTYQTVVSDQSYFATQHFHYIILDESQQIRNKNSKTFQSIHQLKADHRISLSGTPIENSLSDLWSQMEFINPSILGTYNFFKEHFQIPIEKHRDEKALSQLKSLVDPYILRRTKFQVAKDLPELNESIHYATMTEYQRKAYEKEKSSARNHLLGLDRSSGQFRFHVLTSLMKLRQIANHPQISDSQYSSGSGKFEDVKAQLDTIIKSNHKVLVFSSFLSHLQLFEDWLKVNNTQYVKLDGSMDVTEREQAVGSFQKDDKVKVFLLSIKAGGTGLNLTSADYVFILDPWWNPFVEMQAIARAHRIGQERQVMVTRFISKDTIEEKIMLLQSKKKTLSADIIDIADMPELTTSELEGLLED
jgi:non-specific serine/threonine protein kinase